MLVVAKGTAVGSNLWRCGNYAVLVGTDRFVLWKLTHLDCSVNGSVTVSGSLCELCLRRLLLCDPMPLMCGIDNTLLEWIGVSHGN